MKRRFLSLILLLAGSAAMAEPRWYELTSEPQVQFRVPYTMGTHEGRLTELSGRLLYDTKTDRLQEGHFRFKIADLKTGDRKKDCHLQEAMGINYNGSPYPDNHICDDKDQLAKEAVTFPDVTFDIGTAATGKPTSANEVEMEVSGRWKIHGQGKEITVPLQLTKSESGLTVKSSFPLSLKDFGIIVKKFLFIAVEDRVTVTLSLPFKAP